MVDSKNPKPEDVQREFEDFVRQRFGGSVQIFSSNLESDEKEKRQTPIEEDADDKNSIDEFNYTPQEIKKYLDQFVIQQDEAKKALAIAVCDHYHHAKIAIEDEQYSYKKQNVLLLGPTGVGKTYLVKKIADLIGVPFVKADATRFSETGYVGANVDDLVRDLVSAADDDLERAQYGIIYLDEADKIASKGSHSSPNVNSRGVQFGLLRLMEECHVDLKSGNDIHSQMQVLMDMQTGNKRPSKISTKHMLFIVSGAFGGLEDIIEKRINQAPIGFHRSEKEESSKSLLEHVSTEDFLQFGYEAEFIGRLPIRVSCRQLSADDLEHILLDSKESIIHQYKRSFAAYGIRLSFGPGAISAIATAAATEKTGARALMTVCERIMRHYKFELPSLGIEEFVFTEAMVLHPERELELFLKSSKLKQYEEGFKIISEFETDFQQRHGVMITLDHNLKEAIIDHCNFDPFRVNEYLKTMFHSYEHGLCLINSRWGIEQFRIGIEAFQDSQSYLENLITNSYDGKSEINR